MLEMRRDTGASGGSGDQALAYANALLVESQESAITGVAPYYVLCVYSLNNQPQTNVMNGGEIVF